MTDTTLLLAMGAMLMGARVGGITLAAVLEAVGRGGALFARAEGAMLLVGSGGPRV